VAPYRFDAPRLVATAIAAALAILYTALVASFWTTAGGGYGSLADVARLFEHRGVLLAGWVHYLAFDLLIGLWEREQARRLGMSRWLLAPCLFLTLMFGPLGWLTFLALRAYRLQAAAADAPPASTN